MKKFILLAIIICVLKLQAQLPVNNFFYYATTGTTQLYNFNTATNVSTLNTISLPATHIGLAVNNNFFAGPTMTFWTIVGGTFHYYNGATWVNTGHLAQAVNMGGAGPFIYTYNGSTGQVYRYNGTGAATLVTTLGGSLGPYDLTGDALGNFFVMKTNAAPMTLRQFSPTGTLLATYNLIGFPTGTAGGGFAFISGRLYADISGTTVWGTISGTNIIYGGPLTVSTSVGDVANWPLSVIPLPVELLSFEGSYNESLRTNDIQWATSSEINNDYFSLEYSENGIEWFVLDEITGAGNSNELLEYNYQHASPFTLTYYRLKQTDYNGEFKYYNPILITRPENNLINIYPNPTSEIIYVSTDLNVENYSIMDGMGKVVHFDKGDNVKNGIEIRDLDNGMYTIYLYTKDQVFTNKFVKQ